MSFDSTNIFDRNTKNPETQRKNRQLKNMYKVFYKEKVESLKDKKLYLNGYNEIGYLTCFDSYVEAKNKIMLLGKEANTNSGELLEENKAYQRDEYYSCDFAIAHRKCSLTLYLKTRLIISGVSPDLSNLDEKQVLSVLCNNLNKSSG